MTHSGGKDAHRGFAFVSDDCRLVNIKLMRGDSQDITANTLREQVHSAILQVRTGEAQAFDDFPFDSPGGQIRLAALGNES